MINKVKVFIDANIPMYAAGRQHPNKSSSLGVLKLVSEGDIIGITSTEVLQEILYRYKAINLLEEGFKVYDYFVQTIDEVLTVNFQIINNARDILENKKYKNIYPRDAIHAATMNYYNISYIASHDRHFKLFKKIKYYLIK
ncbi:MAG: type II toxin-antitoxin system VapC family toxin [Actinobacteria bacterium]|nr:type II toxin-antitoxin system VapC family toxin [Actinomycetota bacterium]